MDLDTVTGFGGEVRWSNMAATPSDRGGSHHHLAPRWDRGRTIEAGLTPFTQGNGVGMACHRQGNDAGQSSRWHAIAEGAGTEGSFPRSRQTEWVWSRGSRMGISSLFDRKVLSPYSRSPHNLSCRRNLAKTLRISPQINAPCLPSPPLCPATKPVTRHSVNGPASVSQQGMGCLKAFCPFWVS